MCFSSSSWDIVLDRNGKDLFFAHSVYCMYEIDISFLCSIFIFIFLEVGKQHTRMTSCMYTT